MGKVLQPRLGFYNNFANCAGRVKHKAELMKISSTGLKSIPSQSKTTSQSDFSLVNFPLPPAVIHPG